MSDWRPLVTLCPWPELSAAERDVVLGLQISREQAEFAGGRLLLRVDEGNAAGIRAYEKAGWREEGERRVGRVGVERTMTLALG